MFVNSSNFLLKFREFGAEVAVLGFFTISGYSIAHSINKTPIGFYKRRFIRIYPLYFLAVIFSLIPYFIGNSELQKVFGLTFKQSVLWILLCNLTFLQGIVCSSIPSNGALWTLSFEVWCYVIAPALVKISTKKLLLIGFFSALLYLAYSYSFKNLGLPSIRHSRLGLSFFTLFWAWLLGFLYFRYKEKNLMKVILMILGYLILKLSFSKGNLSILTYVISNLTSMYSCNFISPKYSAKQILTFLGDISYPLYLFHMPCLGISSYVLGIKNPITLVSLCLLVAILFEYWERKIKKFAMLLSEFE
jgi:peptidoglycan/LPS O-acetylase OafA/YrhL